MELMIVLILFSLLSGLVTVLSPCILPVLPIVLSSTLTGGKRRPLGVVTGLIISFSIFTLLISQIVSLLGLSANVLRLAAVVIIGILGLSLIMPGLNTRIEKLFSRLPGLVKQGETQGSGFGSGLLTGASLGLIWAPCAGPILAAITTLAATQAVSLGSVLVVVAYAIGAGVPLLAIAYGGRNLMQRVPFLVHNTLRIQRVFGVVMILTAALIAFNVDTMVTAWAADLVPASWTAQLNRFESSQAVTSQLSSLTGGPNSSAPAASSSELQDSGPAPELTGITHWINSNPLTLQSLKGKVVLIDFWTYSCVNCVRTLPFLTSWYGKYQDQGFVIIGVHTPEFAFEHETANVEQAVKRFKITYPVAQDNDYATWRAYHNLYWPAEYLIGPDGHIRYVHFGEGNYDKTEMAIQELLAEAGHPVKDSLTEMNTAQFSQQQTPETYIGTAHQGNFSSPEAVQEGQASTYSLPIVLPLQHFAVSGTWDFEPEFAQVVETGAQLKLHFYAKDVYLVMDSDQPVGATVKLISPDQPNHTEDVNAQGQITIDQARLYHLVALDKLQEDTLVIQFDHPGVKVYSFTFGG
jgi:cytochrome c biogenesis protein CcdA/thiol-disulfide isomerase/thioredoxin